MKPTITLVATADEYTVTLEFDGRKIERTMKRVSEGSMRGDKKGDFYEDLKKLFKEEEEEVAEALGEVLDDEVCSAGFDASQALLDFGYQYCGEQSLRKGK